MSYPTTSTRGRKAIDPALLARLDAARSHAQATERNKAFLTSLFDNTVKWGALSPRQMTALENIESSLTNRVVNVVNDDEWRAEWDDDKAESFGLFLQYAGSKKPSGPMGRSPFEYYGKFLKLIEGQDDFIPSRSQFTKYTRNLYFKRALDEYRRAPVFSVATAVTFRSTVSRHCPAVRAIREAGIRPNDVIAIIAQTDPIFPQTAVKGCKTYRVLFPQIGKSFIVEERSLKNVRNKKKKS